MADKAAVPSPLAAVAEGLQTRRLQFASPPAAAATSGLPGVASPGLGVYSFSDSARPAVVGTVPATASGPLASPAAWTHASPPPAGAYAPPYASSSGGGPYAPTFFSNPAALAFSAASALGGGALYPQISLLQSLHAAVGGVGALAELLAHNADALRHLVAVGLSLLERLGQFSGEVAGFLRALPPVDPTTGEPLVSEAEWRRLRRKQLLRWAIGAAVLLAGAWGLKRMLWGAASAGAAALVAGGGGAAAAASVGLLGGAGLPVAKPVPNGGRRSVLWTLLALAGGFAVGQALASPVASGAPAALPALPPHPPLDGAHATVLPSPQSPQWSMPSPLASPREAVPAAPAALSSGGRDGGSSTGSTAHASPP